MASFSSAAFSSDAFSILAWDFGDPSARDAHDGFRRGQDDREADELFRKRDEEIREERARLRATLLDAVERVTGRPPPLDASPKELAAIARKSESFDYRGTLRTIARLQEESAALAAEREGRIRNEAKAKQRRQEEEAILMLLFH